MANTDPFAPIPITNNKSASVSTKGLQTSYDSPAWYTDEWDRQRQNAQQYAKAGVQYELKADPKTGVPSITYAPGQNLGAIKGDATGGTFDYYGNSNNPNFLKATIGLTREQVDQNETLKGLSDRALYEIYTHGQESYNPITGGTFTNGFLAGNLYWNPYDGDKFSGSGISTHKGEGAVSVTDVRKVLADMTGQKATFAEDLGGWWGGQLAPLVKANYYGDNTNLGTRQQTEVINPYVEKIKNMMASGSSATTAPAVSAAPSASTNVTTEDEEKKLSEYAKWLLSGWR